ncbi:MAG: energy-dependent translational throttle protein EttA [Alphaproteobacteria bacterium]|nr:MAG: energy-dependent translational throttle protein EttA [Alphaproteobacteria bacterium]
MSAYQYIYVMKNLSKTYAGGKQVLKDITLQFLPGVKIGVLGPNGSGKSTLLKIMAGIHTDFQGEAWAADGVKIGYLEQEPQLDNSKTCMENVLEGAAESKAILDKYNELCLDYENADPDEMSRLQDEIDAKDLWDLDRNVEMTMQILNCPPADASVENLSGGEKRRIALARLIMAEPDMLLLDEPTNHLDAESVAWLQNYLTNFKGTVMMITHDRYFLDNVTGWILELDRGQGIPYEGNYSGYLEKKAKRLAQESREDSARQKTLSRELDWIRQSPKARQAKSKARISSYDELLKASQRDTVGNAQIIIPTPERLGDVVVVADNLCKSFGDKELIKNLNFKLPAGGIVGIIGHNGAGKTTLFKMITGEEQPDSGTLTIGETVSMGYVDQSRDSLNDDNNVWEEISGGNDILMLGKIEKPSRAYVGSFNFKSQDQQKKVGTLSGGERNRVHLAKMLQKGSNLLLLDEPTNDLDTETLGALEESLEKFAGCAVVISHDRWFLNRLATHILAFEGNGHVEWFEGNFEDYEKDKTRRENKAA